MLRQTPRRLQYQLRQHCLPHSSPLPISWTSKRHVAAPPVATRVTKRSTVSARQLRQTHIAKPSVVSRQQRQLHIAKPSVVSRQQRQQTARRRQPRWGVPLHATRRRLPPVYLPQHSCRCQWWLAELVEVLIATSHALDRSRCGVQRGKTAW